MEIHKGKGLQKEVKSRKIKVFHDKVDNDRLDYVLFPFGFAYNVDLQKIRKGDIIVFLDKSEHYVFSICKVEVKSAIAECLCYKRYGISLTRAMEIWRDRARFSGYDEKAINSEECLVVWYDKRDLRYE